MDRLDHRIWNGQAGTGREVPSRYRYRTTTPSREVQQASQVMYNSSSLWSDWPRRGTAFRRWSLMNTPRPRGRFRLVPQLARTSACRPPR